MDWKPSRVFSRLAAVLGAASALWTFAGTSRASAASALPAFLETHCIDCHDAASSKGGLNLETLSNDLSQPVQFERWLKIRDAAASGEMPPKKKPRPDAGELARWLEDLDARLLAAEKTNRATGGRSAVRRMTAAEFENALREVLDLPDLQIRDLLPADGNRHGFQKLAEALEISHAHPERYQEAVRIALDEAIATQPKAPQPVHQRIYPASRLKGWLSSGAGVLLEDKQLSPAFALSNPGGPAATRQKTRELEAAGVFKLPHAVGMLCTHNGFGGPRPNLGFGAVHPGRYRVRLSVFGFWWNAGKAEPSKRSEALVLDKTRTGLGFGAQTIGFFEAPSLQSKEHEVMTYLRNGEILFFEGATVPGLGDFRLSKGAADHKGPGVALEWVDVEGPLFRQWPPVSHQRLFGDLPLVPFDSGSGLTPPHRDVPRQIHGKIQIGPPQSSLPPEEQSPVLHTVASASPVEDARRLLAAFLPRAFRRPVSSNETERYVRLVEERLGMRDCLEVALRHAYTAALTSTDFLLVQSAAPALSDTDLAARLAFWLWNSPPDAELVDAAVAGRLRDPAALRAQIDRLLADRRSERFIEDFLDQWLNLRAIDDTVPDRILYPEYDRYLRESMLAESRAFLRALLEDNLPASCSIASPFLTINQRLAEHYGIPDVVGSDFRKVPVPEKSLRGGFLTQASVLKVTANGTTTSPVVRGAFVTERLLGMPIPPPPPNVPAIEPDTRGATTIREILEKHRVEGCASCHRKMDAPGFALESFDVIGGNRERYRSLEKGDGMSVQLPNGRRIKFKVALTVDPSGETAEGHAFQDVRELRSVLAANPERLARAWVSQWVTYATGAEVRFSDRAEVERIVRESAPSGYGLRTLIYGIAQSPLFQQR